MKLCTRNGRTNLLGLLFGLLAQFHELNLQVLKPREQFLDFVLRASQLQVGKVFANPGSDLKWLTFWALRVLQS